ncbi:MAG: hypothetical protein AAGM22_22800 [Acidobacteriota bacterium]
MTTTQHTADRQADLFTAFAASFRSRSANDALNAGVARVHATSGQQISQAEVAESLRGPQRREVASTKKWRTASRLHKICQKSSWIQDVTWHHVRPGRVRVRIRLQGGRTFRNFETSVQQLGTFCRSAYARRSAGKAIHKVFLRTYDRPSAAASPPANMDEWADRQRAAFSGPKRLEEIMGFDGQAWKTNAVVFARRPDLEAAVQRLGRAS